MIFYFILCAYLNFYLNIFSILINFYKYKYSTIKSNLNLNILEKKSFFISSNFENNFFNEYTNFSNSQYIK